MAISAADSQQRDVTGARVPGAWVRGGTWVLHVFVLALAVGSMVTGRFDIWVDLRMLGEAGILVKMLWVGTAVVVPFCAGPRLGGWVKGPRWVHGGVSRVWGRRLLWPTYGVMGCLVANCVYYGWLRWNDLADLMVPMPLAVLLVLAAWVLLTRHWTRNLGRLPTTGRATRGMQVLAGVAAGVIVAVVAGVFGLYAYARPPGDQDKVDLAVVLGNSVRPDGRAAWELTERTRVAIALFKQGRVTHIFLSGGVYPPKREGLPQQNEVLAMKQVCLEAGIPEAALTLDPVGVNTKATAANARAFMKARGYTSVVVCTSEYHMYRTVGCFEEMGVAAFALPAGREYWQSASPRSLGRELAAVVVYELFPHYREPKVLTMQLAAPRVVVQKAAGVLELYDGAGLVKKYACITGGNAGDKAVEGDRRTPVGTFRIVFKNPESKFHLSLGLDYPNREDAQRGLAAGLITRTQYEGIMEALGSDLSRVENQKKLWYTPLGGEIFLHGHAEGRAGTAGCVALANEDIDELYAILPVGTPVEIRP